MHLLWFFPSFTPSPLIHHRGYRSNEEYSAERETYLRFLALYQEGVMKAEQWVVEVGMAPSAAVVRTLMLLPPALIVSASFLRLRAMKCSA